MTSWANRVRLPAPRDLHGMAEAAEDLHQAKPVPGGAGPLMGTVTQLLLLGTALVSSSLAAMHLYSRLSRRHGVAREDHPDTSKHADMHAHHHRHRTQAADERQR
jgi:hypothetical protein